MGVRALLLDIDGTLAEKHAPEPPPAIIAWAEGLKKNGISLFILSNNRHPQRVRRFWRAFGLRIYPPCPKTAQKGLCPRS